MKFRKPKKLVGCFGFNDPLRQYETVFQSISGRLPERGRNRERKDIGE